jgi:MFS superfamily sulfate permease-like transporter
LSSFAEFLNKVIAYIPNAIVAVLILLVTALLADFVGRLIKASAKGTGMRLYQMTSAFAR